MVNSSGKEEQELFNVHGCGDGGGWMMGNGRVGLLSSCSHMKECMGNPLKPTPVKGFRRFRRFLFPA